MAWTRVVVVEEGSRNGRTSWWMGEGDGTPLQYSCLETPWAEEPGRLQSRGLWRVRHDWATSLFTFMHWRRQWQPTPVFLPGDSQGQGCLVGCRLWGQSRTRLKRLSRSSRSSWWIRPRRWEKGKNQWWGQLVTWGLKSIQSKQAY